MSLFICNGCSEQIPAHKARLHCDNCVGDHNTCANCYVIGNYTQRHEEGHESSLIAQSGYQPKPPPVPPRQQVTSPHPAQVSQYNLGQPTAPSSSVPSTTQAVQQGWQPLFSGSAPTALYTAFLTDVFKKIDTDNDGLITPEQYTSFLDVQQYAIEEDVWKKFHKPLPGYTADDVADYELKTSYENFSIRHEMRPRPNTQTAPSIYDSMGLTGQFAQLMRSAAPPKSFSNGMMPMLTLPGFIDITVIETLYEPNPGWIRMNRVANHYRVWREWGDIPRAMMPNAPPNELVQRVKLITQQSQARAQGRINASAAQARLELQGQEAALRLLDPPGTRYYYY